MAVSGPMRELLDGLGNKWTAAVVDTLADHETRRFGDVLQACPLTAKMLTRVLRDLEGAGVVERHAPPGGPAHAAYRLTGRGRALHEHLRALQVWAEDHASPAVTRANLRRRDTGDAAFEWGKPRMHLALVTSRMDATCRLLAALFETPLPARRRLAVDQDAGPEALDVCAWRFGNIVLEVVSSPVAQTQIGTGTAGRVAGIHHFSYYVSRSLPERLDWLARHGGRPVWTSPDGRYGALDFHDALGVSLCVSDHAHVAAHAWPVVDVTASARLAQLSHVGLLVRDLDRAGRTWRALTSLTPSPARRFALTLASGEESSVRMVSCEQPNVTLRYGQPAPGSPLAERLETSGNGVFSLGFQAGRALPDAIRHLTGLGARPLLGGASDTYAVLDLPDEAGFSIEVVGASRRR